MNYPCQGPSSSDNSSRITRGTFGVLASLALALSASAQTAPTPAQPDDTTTGNITNSVQNDQPVQLNRLDVTATKDVGYGAATTASTSRMVQNYIDVPQTVNVVTAEFISDYATQDVRQLLEYTPNITFGLTDNPSSMRIRSAIVNTTYVDGVAISINNTAQPLDFFDRVEIVKGPSSAAFGLGQPGGLINYVSKTPQRTDTTDFYAGIGEYSNYRTGIDLQRVDSHTDKLSYRIVAFGDEGKYEIPNEDHKGFGAQFSVRYDVDPTFRIDLISAYSNTNYPAEQIPNTIWNNETIYSAWQSTNLSATPGIYAYLPGTRFSNGSIFGVSGQLPLPSQEIGVLGTGNLASKDSNSNPAGFFSQGATVSEERETLILNKSFMDGHISVRNALTLDFQSGTTYNESPDEIVAVPGLANTLPAAANGNPAYGVPTGFTDSGYGTAPGYMGIPGQPFFGVGYSLTYNQTHSSSRNDELDLLGDWKLPAGIEIQALAGGDIYDNESRGISWQWPDEVGGVAGGLPFENNVYGSNNPSPPIPNSFTMTGNSNTHQWGDGTYVQGDIKLFNGIVDLNAGWRIDFFQTQTRNYQTAQYTKTAWLNTKGAPRYAITVKPLPWLSFYELYTVHNDPAQQTNKYFLASGTEWGPYLQGLYPQGTIETYQPGGVTIESGAKVQFWGGKAYASVAVFHAINQGQLNSIPVINYINQDGTDTQIGVLAVQGTNVHGIEAELFGQFTPRFSGILNYGFTKGYFPAFANGGPDLIDPSPQISGHFKYDFGDMQGNGFFVNFGGVGFAPYLLWQVQSPFGGPGVYRTYYTSWQYSLDASVGYRWHTGRYKQSIEVESTNFTNQEVSDGTVTPWTVEPMRMAFLTYRVQY